MQHYIRFLSASHQFSLVTGPVHSITSSTPWGAYSPAAIMALVTIQTHKQSLSNQVPIHSQVSRVHIQVKCPAKDIAPNCNSRDPYPRPFSPKSKATVTAPWRPACIWSILYFRCIGALTVITARELVVLSGSLTSHSMSVRRLHHLRGHASHKGYTVSNVERWEINLHKPLPCMTGIEPRAAVWQVHTLPLVAVLLLSSNVHCTSNS